MLVYIRKIYIYITLTPPQSYRLTIRLDARLFMLVLSSYPVLTT